MREEHDEININEAEQGLSGSHGLVELPCILLVSAEHELELLSFELLRKRPRVNRHSEVQLRAFVVFHCFPETYEVRAYRN